jgi:hypothetical protein
MVLSRRAAAAALLQLAAVAYAHGHDEGMKMDMDMESSKPQQAPNDDDPYNLPSYAGLAVHQGLLLAHIALMVVAWFFVLPIGKLVLERASPETHCHRTIFTDHINQVSCSALLDPGIPYLSNSSFSLSTVSVWS